MRGFTIEVTEQEVGEPCCLLVIPKKNVGLAANQHIVIEMPAGTELVDAEQLAREIMERAQTIRIVTF